MRAGINVRAGIIAGAGINASAPKGRHMPAQGNALGGAWKNFPALKGRDNGRATRWVAPSGLGGMLSVTQGVALGWHGSGPWPERQKSFEGLGV